MSDDAPISPYKAVGVSGLVHYGKGAGSEGRIYEEWLQPLVGAQGRRVYREMQDNDPIVGAILFSIEMLCRQVEWTVQPGTDDADGKAVATFVDECLHDMDQTWPDTLAEILSMLPYGWSLHEQVYKRRVPGASKHADGKVGWKGWFSRGQETLNNWQFNDENTVDAMVQLGPPDYQYHTIPLAKSLLFRTTSRKQNPEGRSILRNAYTSWYKKKHIENIEAIAVERDLAGMPVLGIPAEVIVANGTDYANYQRLIRNIRVDEQGGVILPSDCDPVTGKPYYTLSLLGSPGQTKLFDTDVIVTRHEQRMAMVVMADFIMIGHDKVGSNAMVRSKGKLFTTAITSYLDSIQDIINDVAIPRLLRYNGISTDHAPKAMHGDIERAELDVLGTFLYNLAQAGVVLDMAPGSDLYNFVMKQAGLPESGPLTPGMEPESPDDAPPGNPKDQIPDAPPTPAGQAVKPATPQQPPAPRGQRKIPTGSVAASRSQRNGHANG